MKKQRNSKIETLRLISMLFIVISHYCVHNGVVKYSLPIGLNRFLLEIGTLGNIGVIIFTLITGYFMVEKDIKDIFNLRKILRFIFEVLFYSLGIYIIFILLGREEFSIINFVKSMFPITFKQYWFATAYFVLYLLSPFLNKFINSVSKNYFFFLNMILFIIFSLINTFSMQDFYGNQLVQMIMFYLMGAYLRKYYNVPTKKQIKYNKLCLIAASLLIICSIILIDLLGLKINSFSRYSTYFLSRTSPLAIIFSICLFNIFSWGKPFCSKIINMVASSAFGIYLIHDNNRVRKLLWVNLLHVADYVSSNVFILHLFGSVILVFGVCSIISLLRNIVFEKFVFKFIDKKIVNIQLFLEKKFSTLKKING